MSKTQINFFFLLFFLVLELKLIPKKLLQKLCYLNTKQYLSLGGTNLIISKLKNGKNVIYEVTALKNKTFQYIGGRRVYRAKAWTMNFVG